MCFGNAEISENNGTEEIGLVTPTPAPFKYQERKWNVDFTYLWRKFWNETINKYQQMNLSTKAPLLIYTPLYANFLWVLIIILLSIKGVCSSKTFNMLKCWKIAFRINIIWVSIYWLIHTLKWYNRQLLVLYHIHILTPIKYFKSVFPDNTFRHGLLKWNIS